MSSCNQAPPRLAEDPYAFTETSSMLHGSLYQSSYAKKLPSQTVSFNANGLLNKSSTIYSQTIAKLNQPQQQPPMTFHTAFSKQVQRQNTIKQENTSVKPSLVKPVSAGKTVKLPAANNLPQQVRNQNVQKSNLLVPENNGTPTVVNHSTMAQQAVTCNVSAPGKILVHQQAPSINSINSTVSMPYKTPTAPKVLEQQKCTRSDVDSGATFAKPKQQSGSFARSSSNAVTKTNTSNGGKRSFGNASYHETVQRIAPSESKVKAALIKDWHAPDSYIFDDVSPNAGCNNFADAAPIVQKNWYMDYVVASADQLKNEPQTNDSQPLKSDPDELSNKKTECLSREERIQVKRNTLRRKAVQYRSGQHLRNNLAAKRRLANAWKVLTKLDSLRMDEKPEPILIKVGNECQRSKCSIANCNQKPLVMTSYCYQHITSNTEQRLFHLCTAKFSDNTQCRVPVFDISHELPLCSEHAWKRDNYNKMAQEMKPKKPPRKKSKTNSTASRPSKRNKKKKKLQAFQLASDGVRKFHEKAKSNFLDYDALDNSPQLLPPPPQYSTLYPNYSEPALVHSHQTQDFLSTCENSSAYASSEDTGVGGLSESELMAAQDVIEEIPFIETHELTNVLSQIPPDAFNELFNEQQNTFEPTQEEQDHLDFVLEAVDKHVKNLEEQMPEISTNFLGDFLDNVDDEMLTTDQILQTDIRGLVHT